MFTYPISGGGLPVSDFDLAVEALSPTVWYKFEDDSYATTLTDSGSLGATLTSQNTTDASAGSAFRTTKSKSLAMPACTASNWSTEAAHYTDSGNAFGTAQGNLTGMTVIHTIRMASNSANYDIYLFRLGTNLTLQTNAGIRCMMTNPNTEGKLSMQERHTTLGYNFPETTSTNLDDGTVHFIVYRFGPSAHNATLDGVEEFTAGWNRTTLAVTAPFNVGGHANATQALPAWETDCFAFWDSYLSDAAILDLWTKYNAEKI